MAVPHTAKPATPPSEPASSVEQLGGRLNWEDTREPTRIQANRLRRLYALTIETASTIATLAYGVAR
jgi:hypothetical protein